MFCLMSKNFYSKHMILQKERRLLLENFQTIKLFISRRYEWNEMITTKVQNKPLFIKYLYSFQSSFSLCVSIFSISLVLFHFLSHIFDKKIWRLWRLKESILWCYWASCWISILCPVLITKVCIIQAIYIVIIKRGWLTRVSSITKQHEK